MPRSLARREADIAEFREVFGRVAQEFNNPVKWETDDGDVVIPFKYKGIRNVGDIGPEKQAVFEVNDRRSKVAVRVDYSSEFGLRVRRQLETHRKSGLLIRGEIEYDLGGVTAGFYADYRHRMFLSDFNAVGNLSDPTHFLLSINIQQSGRNELPPLASALYNFYPNIPVDIVFPFADYENAITGNYGIREYSRAYSKTFFSWVDLSGAEVGSEVLDGEKQRPKVNSSNISLENGEWIGLEGTAYEVKIGYVPGGMNLQRGRLRLFRRNQEVDEEWMFSVPAWMYTGRDFMSALKEKSLREFLSQYPVIFSIKGSGETKLEVFTSSREDPPVLNSHPPIS